MKKILFSVLTCIYAAGYAQQPAKGLWQKLDPVSLSGDTPTGDINMFTITSISQDKALISFTDKKRAESMAF
jgi:hypothetical protein